MAQGYETKTQILEPEIQKAEPQLLYLANDRDFQIGGNDRVWHEMAVIDNGDHTRTLQIGRWDMVSDERTPFEGSDPYAGKSDEGSYLGVDYFVAEDLYEAYKGEIKDAAEVLGYDIKKGHNSYFITYTKAEAKNKRLRLIRDLTGYAPKIITGHEGLYTYREQADAFDEDAILISSSPEDEEHDAINHELALEFLAPSTFGLIAKRTRQVVNEADEALQVEAHNPSPDSPSDYLKQAMATYKKHFYNIEVNLGRRLVEDISLYLDPNTSEIRQKVRKEDLMLLLQEVIFGDTYNAEDPVIQDAIITYEAEKTIGRVRTLAGLKRFLPE